jgi:enterochelin esterase-like enzyme
MKKIFLLLCAAVFGVSVLAQQAYNVRAPFDPATVKMAEDKRGEVLKFTINDSKYYPGTEREILVYVPQSYQSNETACLLVCMDGILYDATTVMDNLIATGEMPVTVGVFVNPGVVYDEDREVVRYNRCKEFDSTDDTFARFLEEEVLTRVEGMQTEKGKVIHLSADANDRAITGASSGGIAAFTAAWNRPDLFSRVYTTVGTFVAMRGGHEYPAIVRKTEPKPLRIYMQDGWYDVWNPIFGEWFEYNLLMESAFNFAGYEVFHKWDRGNHSIKYGTLAFPDAMRWLWKGYPARVQKGWSNNGMLQEILLQNEDWQQVQLPVEIEGDLYAAADHGVVFASGNKVYKVLPQDGAYTVVRHAHLKRGEQLVGDGLTMRENVLYKEGKMVADSLEDVQAVCALDGDKYLVLGNEKTKASANVWVATAGSRALAIAPDYRMCVTGEDKTHHLISTVITKAGKMIYSEPYYYMHDLSNGTKCLSGNMAFDTKGNLYVATEMGVQVADHNGRVRAILSLSAGGVQSLAFSGKYLYVVCGDKMFVRKMQAEGHLPANGKVMYKSQGQG